MRTTVKKIDPKYLPYRSPLISSVVLWFLLDRLDASDITWGIVGTLMTLAWFGWLCGTRFVRPEEV